jgi:diguanylate cyclase (GGDEF)-like protein
MLGERLRSAIEGASFEGTSVRVTASVGVASFASLADKSAAGLVGAADAAVYAAKAAGRNAVQVGCRPQTGTVRRDEIPTSRFRSVG